MGKFAILLEFTGSIASVIEFTGEIAVHVNAIFALQAAADGIKFTQFLFLRRLEVVTKRAMVGLQDNEKAG